MVAETISLGVLALPKAVAGLGLASAIVIIVGIGTLAWYTGYVVGQFKWKYPHICGMPDAGEVIMGGFGRELLFTGQMLYLVFNMASNVHGGLERSFHLRHLFDRLWCCGTYHIPYILSSTDTREDVMAFFYLYVHDPMDSACKD